MSFRPHFDVEYVESEFERIGTRLDEPLTVYLIGGGAMALRNRKESTKDIDVVVDSESAYSRFRDVLSRVGYREIDSLEDEYRQLGARCCVENEDGCRFDVFDRQVVGKLLLTDGMKNRTETFHEFGGLTVELVSEVDVFLFKAVANRPADVDDMNVLVQAGLDFGVVERELRTQMERLDELQFVTYVLDSLGRLEERHGASLPFTSTVRDLAKPFYELLEVYLCVDGPTPIANIETELGLDEEEVVERVERLEARGKVSVEDEVVYEGEERNPES